AGPARNYRTAERMSAALEHRARGRQVIGEAIVYKVARAEPRREERAGEPPVVAPLALGIVDRAGRHEDTCELARLHRGQTTERRCPLLALDQLGFSYDRQLREIRTGSHAFGIDVSEERRECWRMRLRVRDLLRQCRKHRLLSRLGIAGLERVVKLGFCLHEHPASFDSALRAGSG